MRVGFIGLGKMGSQIVTKLVAAGHEVVAHDPNHDAVEAMAKIGAIAAENRQDLVQKSGDSAVIWLMIPSQFVGDEVSSLLEHMSDGMTLVDGGNSNFTLSMERTGQCQEHGVSFIDIGTSGGILGLTNGFSMMVGGDADKVAAISPLLDVLSQPHGGYHHFGPAGSGHFVKMVHNGIEYGMMQAYSEGYQLLKENSQFPGLDLAAIAHVWQQGSIVESGLNGLIEKIYQQNPYLDGIDGYVADSGEGRWTLEQANTNGVDMPVLRDAIAVRIKSQNGDTNYATKLLASMRNAFGGHAVNK